MDFTKNIDAMNKINELGSIVNAYTTYNGTNYNIFGNEGFPRFSANCLKL